MKIWVGILDGHNWHTFVAATTEEGLWRKMVDILKEDREDIAHLDDFDDVTDWYYDEDDAFGYSYEEVEL